MDTYLKYLAILSIISAIGYRGYTMSNIGTGVVAHGVKEVKYNGKEVACDICKIIVKMTELLIEQNATDAEIIEAVSKVCIVMPRDFRKTCTNIVQKYIDELLKYVENFSPDEACIAIKKCTAEQYAPYILSDTVRNNTYCVECIFLATLAEQWIVTNATTEEIEMVLDLACGIMPDPIREGCYLIVQTYIPEMIALLEEKYPPGYVCKKIGLCT